MPDPITDKAPAPVDLDRLREALAALEHERWAGWQRYVHARGVACTDGSIEIPPALVERWERQIVTPYAELTEDEKNSDRVEADKTMALLRNLGVLAWSAELALALDDVLLADMCDVCYEDDGGPSSDTCDCRCHDQVRAARDHALDLLKRYRTEAVNHA